MCGVHCGRLCSGQVFFFFKQKTAYEMRISDWSSDVCSSDLAVPGMVGATINHLACLRRMCDDKGWIKTLMDEAENERMHLMTFIEISKPTLFERAVIIGAQWVFYVCFFALYLISSKTAHRVVGYFEEEAVISYTHYLAAIDEGRSPNVPAPNIATAYWGL